MPCVDLPQDPYIDILYWTTSEHPKIYSNIIVGLPENDRYDLTISKWTWFLPRIRGLWIHILVSKQQLVFTQTDIYPIQIPNSVMWSLSIHQWKFIVYLHCEILWSDNLGANLGRHSTEYYVDVGDVVTKQLIISHKRLASNMLSLWIQTHLPLIWSASWGPTIFYMRAVFFFVIIKMVHPGTRLCCSDK